MRQNLPVAYSADQYDHYTAHSVDEFDDRMLRRIRLELRFMSKGPRRLVDVGTGTAQLPVQIAGCPHFADVELVGTDYFEDMVEKARETVQTRGLQQRIRIDHNDVHAMPYPDEFADFVISRSTIHHWAEPVTALREIYRILRPGGVAIIHEPRRNPHPKALAEFNRRRAELGVPAANMDEKYTAEEIWRFVQEAGIARDSMIFAPRRGPGSMGLELRIARQSRARHYLSLLVGKTKMLLTAW
jgi:ubiquinone/menaquinone biosynthesis C-methylase UbiE